MLPKSSTEVMQMCSLITIRLRIIFNKRLNFVHCHRNAFIPSRIVIVNPRVNYIVIMSDFQSNPDDGAFSEFWSQRRPVQNDLVPLERKSAKINIDRSIQEPELFQFEGL